MRDSFLIPADMLNPARARPFVAYDDDDEDEADYDDDDEEDSADVRPGPGHWPAATGFASPAWWSQ